jgi:urease accessory protein
MKRTFLPILLTLCLIPTAAFAHPALGGANGFVHGFMHPLSGLDHQLAMVMVGLFAYQLGGRALWLVPFTFVGVMALGGFLGVMGISIPFVETGIALSVIVLGAIVAFDVKASLAGAMGAVGLFAIFHGHAHGTEMPLDVAESRIRGGLPTRYRCPPCARHFHRLPDRHVEQDLGRKRLSRRWHRYFFAGIAILLGYL